MTESRVSADLHFRRRFRRKLFEPTVNDGKAVLDMSTQCKDEGDFVSKLQTLTNFVTRFSSKLQDLIADTSTRQRTSGSINILKTILDEEFETYDSEIISSLRKINTLRSQMHPTDVITHQAVEVLEHMGFQYPPNDWNQVWETVLDLCCNSLKKLTELLRSP